MFDHMELPRMGYWILIIGRFDVGRRVRCCTGAARDGMVDVHDVARGFQLWCKWRLVHGVSAKARWLVMASGSSS